MVLLLKLILSWNLKEANEYAGEDVSLEKEIGVKLIIIALGHPDNPFAKKTGMVTGVPYLGRIALSETGD
jgi:hypothetical protein